MSWTDEDKAALNSFKRTVDCDNTRFKQIIKERIINNRFIIHVLNNNELDEDSPDEYLGVNIIPYYAIDHTVTKVENWICFETNFDEEARYNDIVKHGQIIFYILCDLRNNVERDTGIPRHDLLSALILDHFNWTNIFGMQIHCVSDRASIVDTNYACRTLVFEGKFLNSIAKTRNGSTRVVNSDVVR